MRGASSAFIAGAIEQLLKGRVGCRVVHLVRERAQSSEQRRTHIELARVDNQRGEAVLAGGAARCDHAAEGATDQHDPLLVDLRFGGEAVEHRGHDVLPVRSHGHALVIEHRSLARAVDSGERVPAVERRSHGRIQLLGGSVVAADVQNVGCGPALAGVNR